MKILVLSRDKNYYSTRRLVTEALKLRHQAVVIDPLECEISLGKALTARSLWRQGHHSTLGVYTERSEHRSDHEPLLRRSECALSSKLLDLSSFDLVIPRIGIVGVDYALLVAHQLEFMGKPMLNSARSLSYAKNKFLALQILAKSGIPVPDTLMTHSHATVKETIKKLGGLPVILKLFRGSQGKGVMLAENIASVESILASVWAIGFDIILQKYLKETKGSDIRVLVLNNEIIGAMKRTPAKGDFRSNVHQGGAMKKVVITPKEKQLTLDAAEALGLKLAGIDIMRTRTGPIVLEANASPGFEGLEKVTGLNIARRIVEYACRLA